jgi:hypothetical protein
LFALALTLSVAGLLAGPVLVAWARGRSVAVAALDGATLGIVPALLLVRLLPHLVEEVGGVAFLALAAGYVAFQIAESRAHGRAARLGLALVLPALALHSFLDGAALAIAFSKSAVVVGGAALGGALVVHKIPEGLFLASRLGSSVGIRAAFGWIGALGATTILGALSGRELLAHTSDPTLHVIVAVGLGVMLRMVFHRHVAPETGTKERMASGCAFVLCLVPIAALPSPFHLLQRSQPAELSAMQAIVPLFLESSPWLLAVLAVSELAGRRLPQPRPETDEAPSAWLASTALTLVLMGPVFAVARAVLDPALRSVASRLRPFSFRAGDIAPRAALVLPSYAAGVVLSLVAEAAMPAGVLVSAPVVALPAAMAAAYLLPVGPAGASVIAAVLVHKGLPPSAGLAFLLTGAVRRSRSPWNRRALVLAAVGVCAGLAGWMLPTSGAPSLHDLGTHQHHMIEWIAAAVLVGWTAAELVRQGPRAWMHAAFSRRTAQASG